MRDNPDKSVNAEVPLAVPGVVCVSLPGAQAAPDQRMVRLGSAAGWMVPAGITQWERELSFVARGDLTVEFGRALRATMAHEQIAPKRFPTANRAVGASPLLALSDDLVDDARKLGVRVHTLGVDRVSSDFFYFADGGALPPLNVQGNLIDILAPSLDATTTNADIAALLEGIMDRLLVTLSGGVASELAVELADALPRLSRTGTGLVGTDLTAFEAQARDLIEHSAPHDAAARRLAAALTDAGRRGLTSVRVPLYGEARNEPRPPLEVSIGGRLLRLPEWPRWTVTGAIREESVAPHEPSPRPAPAPLAVSPAPAPQRRDEAPQEILAPALPTRSPVIVAEPLAAAAPPSPVLAAPAEAPAPVEAFSPPPPAREPVATESPSVVAESIVAKDAPSPPPAAEDLAPPPDGALPPPPSEAGPPDDKRPAAEKDRPARARKDKRGKAQREKAAAATKDKPRGKARTAAKDRSRTSRTGRPGETPARPRPTPPQATGRERRDSLALLVVGLVAFAGALAYSAWHLLHWAH